MSFNQSFGQQQQQGGPGQQQGQFGNVNMRPPQRSNSNSSLSSIQPFPPGATPAQGNIGPNPAQMQQYLLHHQQQQQQAAYAAQQQGQAQGSFGPALGAGNFNPNPMYGNTNASQPTFAQQQQNQQTMARLQAQAQYMQQAQQIRAQAQASQRPPQGSPHLPSLPLPGAAASGGFQRPPLPSNQSFPHPSHPPIPMPMQRTFSNQSNGSGQAQGAVTGQVQGQAGVRPQLPISGYQPHLPQRTGGPSGNNAPAQSIAAPLSLTPGAGPSTAAPKAPAPPPAAEPPKKKRKKVALPATKKEEKPTPVVYFTGIDKSKAEQPVLVRADVGADRVRAVGVQAVQAPNAPAPAERRRAGNIDGMRGTMRSEIAKLMHAAGDVADPALDSVNYVEDLVVEFISDLCRPSPPIRSNPSGPHIAQPINAAHLRHRLQSAAARKPALIKYANRFDYLVAVNEEIVKFSREVDKPSNEDLANTAGKDYLGIGDEGAPGGAGGGGGAGKRGRPKKGDAPPGGERRKPGPKKGWKTAPSGAPGEGPKKRGPYKKRNREGSGMMTPKVE